MSPLEKYTKKALPECTLIEQMKAVVASSFDNPLAYDTWPCNEIFMGAIESFGLNEAAADLL